MDGLPTPPKVCPIVEAVIDIRCDLPPTFKLAGVEAAAQEKFGDRYPKFRQLFVDEHHVEQHGNEPPRLSAHRGLQALQFMAEDQRQLVQVRTQGFSFNRLAPYTSLDEYLPEIERTLNLFIELARPVQVREIRLRYINRLLLPVISDRLEFNDYLKVGPRLQDEENLTLNGFLDQHTAVEVSTGHQINLILTMQPGLVNNRLPVILDIEVVSAGTVAATDWQSIQGKVQALRILKNRMFRNTLTDKCLKLYSL